MVECACLENRWGRKALRGSNPLSSVCFVRQDSAAAANKLGEVAERLKALVSKTGRVARPSWVQIPPSPLLILMLYDDVVNR